MLLSDGREVLPNYRRQIGELLSKLGCRMALRDSATILPRLTGHRAEARKNRQKARERQLRRKAAEDE